MTLEGLIILIVIGAIAGWLAGNIVKGGGFGLIGDIIVGIIGGFIGGWLWGVLHRPGLGPGGSRRSSARQLAPASCCSSSVW
jgi:uncharacterized membrane protein YeaQ/YmgE (transglycosylase-associated protein family)